MSNPPQSAQRRSSRMTLNMMTTNSQPTKPQEETVPSLQAKPRPPSQDNAGSIKTSSLQIRQGQSPKTLNANTTNAQQMSNQQASAQQLSQQSTLFEPAVVPSFNAPGYAPPSYLLATAPTGASPTKRPVPQARTLPQALRETSQNPEVWELTQDLMHEFEGLTMGSSSPLPTMASTLLGPKVLDRTRQSVSYQTPRYAPRAPDSQPLRVSVDEGEFERRPRRPEQAQTSPVTSLSQKSTPPARPPGPGQPLEPRRLPDPPITLATRLNGYDTTTTGTGTTPSYHTALSTQATTDMTGTSSSGRSPPFAFDDRLALKTPPRTADMNSSIHVPPRGTPERDTRPIDDRDEVDEDRTPQEEDGGWQPVSARHSAAFSSEQIPPYASFDTQTTSARHSPTPSSNLIPTDLDELELDTDLVNTPRSPPATLPMEPPFQSLFSQTASMNSIEAAMFALQSAMVLPAPVPTRAVEGVNFLEGHPVSVPLDFWPSREPSVAAPSISASYNGAYHSRPSAPIPPTPNTGTNAPTPAPLPPPSVSDSYSSSSYPGPRNPYLAADFSQSLQSSPSHAPLPLPNVSNRVGFPRRVAHRFSRAPPSESGESTEPLETESEGEENEDDVWLDEPSDDELDMEYHPSFITHPSRRRQKFEQKWSALISQFRELDRTTDATMILMASTPEQRHTHLVLSRAILRERNYMPYAQNARQSFSFIAEARRRERAAKDRARKRDGQQHRSPPVDEASAGAAFAELSTLNADTINGEDNLKHALNYALTSLREMHQIYETREERRRQEAERQQDEQVNIEAMLRALGVHNPGAAPS